ncbi:hypothetical protein A9Q78_11440 [Methylophaga sp. 41_12_T18]|nr:hypothetical protein A9Q78_11440 [Methylophaga sp. 41_12_T18]
MMDFVITMINKQRFLSLLLLGLSSLAQANCDFDDFPVMDEMQVQSVMDDANYNNRPMMVRSFYADVSYQSVVNHYHKRWDKRYDDTAFGIWHQITTMTDDCMMTVQVTPQTDSDSHGRLIISNPPTIASTEPLGGDVIAPSDAIVVSDLTTNDGPKLGRITMLASSDSVSEVASFYQSEMVNKGWVSDRDFSEDGAKVLVFRNGLNVSNIVLIPAGDGTTQILINEETVK